MPSTQQIGALSRIQLPAAHDAVGEARHQVPPALCEVHGDGTEQESGAGWCHDRRERQGPSGAAGG